MYLRVNFPFIINIPKNRKRNGHAEKKRTFLKCPFFNTWHYKLSKKVGSLDNAAKPEKMIFVGLHNFFIFLEKDIEINVHLVYIYGQKSPKIPKKYQRKNKYNM